jgi:hypothetical protein
VNRMHFLQSILKRVSVPIIKTFGVRSIVSLQGMVSEFFKEFGGTVD